MLLLTLLGLCDTSWVEVRLFSDMRLSALTLRTSSSFAVKAVDDSVSVNGQLMPEFSVWGPQDKEITVRDGQVVRTYTGKITVRSRANTLVIINRLRFEDYLASVVAAEIGQAPKQALMAQAVLSRTLVHKHATRTGAAFADNESFQVYHGTGALTRECLDAVRSTRDQVLTWKGRLVEVFFHGSCGGHTARASQVWGGYDLPYLAFVVDSPCLKDTSQGWTKSLSLDYLEKHLGTDACPEVVKRDSSGRARLIRLGGVRIRGAIFRKKLGLRSTMITEIHCSGDSVVISGRGYGHGIGMCQTGASLRAEAGASYQEILEFYYPGARITQVQDDCGD